MATEDVHLVTNDTAFYEGRDRNQGLAKSLRREIRDIQFELKIHSTLEELLSEIRTEVEVDKATLVDAVFESRGQSIEDIANRNSFSIAGESDVSMNMFATEDPTVLFVSFTLSIPCDDISGQDRNNAKVTISGEGMYNVDDSRFVSVSTRGERLTYIDEEGAEQTQANVSLVVGGAVIGHREVFHEIRFGL